MGCHTLLENTLTALTNPVSAADCAETVGVTFKTHVASLLTRLDADTRVELATIAAGEARRGACLSTLLSANPLALASHPG